VTGIGTINCTYGLSQVCIDITHTWAADLDITVTDPSGDVYLLTSDNGGGGNNYSVTCFDMTAATAVTAGSAPFNGSYVPEGDLAAVNNGQNANGTWTLNVTDDAGGDVGTLVSWSLVFAASPPCPPAPLVEDCEGGITVCSDATFTGNSSGAGDVNDLSGANDGCLSGEHESSWYYFQAATDGTYAFMIETGVDYDFAVWGPMASVTCPPPSAPIRCSYSGTVGNTGLSAGAGDNTEGSGGDAIVDPIDALAGEVYIFVIDNYTSDGSSFNLVWTVTGGGLLDCTPLPVELISFKGEGQGNVNQLEWITKTEINCSHYTIERSKDGVLWDELNVIAGSGNSNEELIYEYRDYMHDKTLNYYRLSQVDFDGEETGLGTISIDNRSGKQVQRMINLMGEEIDESYRGVKVYIYTDGTMDKIVTQQ
jgi:subtilisin-like proprotein convertase family protein